MEWRATRRLNALLERHTDLPAGPLALVTRVLPWVARVSTAAVFVTSAACTNATPMETSGSKTSSVETRDELAPCDTNSQGSVAYVAGEDKLVACVAGNWQDVILKGGEAQPAPGPQGPKGNSGQAGPAGSAGPIGPSGPPGPPGPQQPAGSAGPQGPSGPAGQTGPAGVQGPPGPSGTPGPAGPSGSPGPAGPAGSAEAEGPPGPPGPHGPAGPAGSTGPQGPSGPSGTSGRDASISVTSAPRDQCPNGGVVIHSGIDLNRNGVLDANEVTATATVCFPRENLDGGAGPAVTDSGVATDTALNDDASQSGTNDASDANPTDNTPIPSFSSSCRGGLRCGNVSCCESILVPGGTFPMGRSQNGSDACPSGMPQCYAQEQPEHSVTVDSFRLDAFEVTVGRFRAFVESYRGAPQEGAGDHHGLSAGWRSSWNNLIARTQAELRSDNHLLNRLCSSTYRTWTDTPGNSEQRPMSCLTWFEAFAFCVWDGGRLPTEAEWEYAAVGGDENRLYPWGFGAVDGSRAVYDVTGGIGGIAHQNVGSKPAGTGRWGHHDLAGSVWEFTSDSYRDNWYQTDGRVCSNCANTRESMSKTVRGGGFEDPYFHGLRPTFRLGDNADYRYAGTGVRCARPVTP